MRTTGTSAVLEKLVHAWDRVRVSPVRKGLFLYAVAALLLLCLVLLPDREHSAFASVERSTFDRQMRILRAVHPRPVADEVVLIGTDEQTYRLFEEPVALWHIHFAGLMHALAKARPRAVGMDFVLPENSFEKNLPGGDLAMMRGIVNLKRATHLVYVQTIDSQGGVVNVQRNYRAIVRDENLGMDQQVSDPDGTSRRFESAFRDESGQPLPTLVGQMLKGIGRPAGEGFIDYSLGAPIRYIPLQDVEGMDEATLAATFKDKVVLVGSLINYVDRWTLPVRLLAVDPGRRANGLVDEAYVQSGVLIHLQALRTALGPGFLQSPRPAATFLLCAIALLAVLLHGSAWRVIAAALLVPAALLAASLVAIVTWQILLPVATLAGAFCIALAVRGLFDAGESTVERVRLHRTFAGQVSPAVMQEMLGGSLTPGINGQLAEVCVLFSDVRDFTTLSEAMSPDVVTAVLQRYFDRMVKAVHRFDGTVDKFIGDGMMVLFGAPQKLPDACGQAVECALAMLDGLDALNKEFAAEGLPVLTIGIGINFGVVTVGNIGSSERHNYSAIGDAVNVAARLEGLTKDLKRKILITEAVVDRLGGRFSFEPLGSHNVKGHSPVRVWGIRTRVVENATAPVPENVAA